jgi:SAM-dependent methyltransferase
MRITIFLRIAHRKHLVLDRGPATEINPHGADSVLAEYRRRDASGTFDTYSLAHDVNLFFHQGRSRHGLALLRKAGFFPCTTKMVLEIGCGARGWLPDLETWGVPRSNLAGIDLDEARVQVIQRLLSPPTSNLPNVTTRGADIRVGDASRLPWPANTFDLLVQSTVFTSILSTDHKHCIAAEMFRVLKGDGLILWYDFVYNNPANPMVRGVGLSEVKKLFPNCRFRSRLITLAPPLARVIVPRTWLLAEFLQALRVLNTHRLIVIQRIPPKA